VGNSADKGGGACGGTLYNCTINGNSAGHYGGGVLGKLGDMWVPSATLNNCTLTGNSADQGGGACAAMLNNCTLMGNSADSGGGGISYCTVNNSIVYYNSAGPRDDNYSSGTFNYCCTTPLPAGPGNLVEEPQLASTSHLSARSPCIGRGSAAYASGLDTDGEPWANPPSIGCDEYWRGSVTGALSVALVAAYTNVAVGFGVDFQGVIGGRVSASRWDFGNGTVVSNRPWASHAWAAAGDYVVELRAYNDSFPAGVAATVTVHVTQEEHYVALNSSNPVPPYTNWVTAASNIQDAVDAATLPGALVWVSNGVYQAGARAVDGMSNRVALTKPLTVRSVNGPEFTVIQGYQVPGTTNGDGAIRCVYLADGASLSGFTLTNGATRTAGDWKRERQGGGAWCASSKAVLTNCALVGNSAGDAGGGASSGTLYDCVLLSNSAPDAGGGVFAGTLYNCVLVGNSAGDYGGGASSGTLNNCSLTSNSAGIGGGADGCTVYNCTFTGNSASSYGGGAYEGTLNNCTLVRNSAYEGGGVFLGTLYNCIVYFNTADTSTANYRGGALDYCCTIPLPTNGVGNITNAPLFVDFDGGNLRLQSNSPCINAGNNAYAPGSTDLDGNPRIVSGTVDIGAYEYQGTGSIISYAWLQQYGLPTDGSADSLDPDHDGHNNWQEWRCQTDPTNPLSVLRVLWASPTGTNVTVTWQSVAGVNYFLERSTNLRASPPFTLLSPSVLGQPDATSFTDTNPAPLAPLFYRVGVSQ